MIADPIDAVISRQIAGASLRTFMRLPVAQRSSVILMDVLGCSLSEVCEVMDFSLPAVKAALHRGRTRLRELADEPDDLPLAKLSDADRDRLGAYVAHFNARDFDAIRAMIADDVRLDLVSKTRMNGKAEVSRYFGNYDKVGDWRLVPGLLEGRPAILVFDPNEPDAGPKYFMLLQWSADKVATIRDFRHAAYVIDGAEYRSFRANLNRGEYQSAEYKRFGKGGKEVWILASYNPILDDTGKPFKVVKFASDVSAQS